VGAQLLYLPPYSPDFNPIELAWSKVKQLLRDAKARTLEVLETAWPISVGHYATERLRLVCTLRVCFIETVKTV